MKLFKLGLLTMVIVAFGSINGVKADTIDPFKTWYEFSFTDRFNLAQGCDPADPGGLPCVPSSVGNTEFAPEPAWEFSSLNAFNLIVTDAFDAGDAFLIFNYGCLIGWTNPVKYAATSIDNPDIALLDNRLSHRSFQLPAGNYSISIIPYKVVDLGAGYFTASVPEPATFILLGFGLLSFFGLKRRLKV